MNIQEVIIGVELIVLTVVGIGTLRSYRDYRKVKNALKNVHQIEDMSEDPAVKILQSAYNLSQTLEASGELELSKEVIAVASRQYQLLQKLDEHLNPKELMRKQVLQMRLSQKQQKAD